MASEDDLKMLRTLMQEHIKTLRLQLAAELSDESAEHYRDISGEVTDSGDEAIGAELAGLENAVIGHNVTEVRDLEAALERITQGSCGYCIDCRGEIELERLKAYPTCKRCQPCQRAYEHTYAGTTHPSL
ncbi:MAG TPA: TraR/DksA C4-type zinc finger protein [Burkholderiaceae bacterium]|nr:TraR/DksA C4-type zinc finger protein [Burkholderiaceae bacterium]